ncbi:MAG: type II secretion system protein, partial [Ottowia sp.]|nr:type II secretion system protein [Ottowia sp.]
PTPNPRFRRVDVTVSERGHSVVRVTTIVGNN